MTNKLLLAAVAAALATAAFQASAEPPYSPRVNDENDTSWLYQAPGGTAKVFRDRGPIGAPFVPYYGDENDTSWVYAAPPYERKGSASAGDSASVGSSRGAVWTPFVPYWGDENDTSWVYVPAPRK